MRFMTVISSFIVAGILLIAAGCSDDTAVRTKSVFDDTVNPRQTAFCELISDYRYRYESIYNGPDYIDKEGTLKALFQERAAKLQHLLSPSVVHGWRGIINDIISEQGLRVGLKVRLNCDAELYTSDEFMIPAGTILYNRLRQYKEGEQLMFSGRFIEPPTKTREHPYKTYFAETSLTHNGSIKYPEFYFEFTRFSY